MVRVSQLATVILWDGSSGIWTGIKTRFWLGRKHWDFSIWPYLTIQNGEFNGDFNELEILIYIYTYIIFWWYWSVALMLTYPSYYSYKAQRLIRATIPQKPQQKIGSPWVWWDFWRIYETSWRGLPAIFHGVVTGVTGGNPVSDKLESSELWGNYHLWHPVLFYLLRTPIYYKYGNIP